MKDLLVLQALRLQTSANVVETAVMHILEVAGDTSQMRVSTMHETNPLHTFMFSSRGKLLNANQAALEACRYSGEQHAHSLTQGSAVPSLSPCLPCSVLVQHTYTHI